MNPLKNKGETKGPGGRHHRMEDPLELVLRRIRRTRDFPTISKYVVEINKKITESAIQSSASELANIILKDYALTNKLLKLVNSAFYGFVSGKVTTVTRAVVLLGYDNVRLAALSLLLFDHFKGKSGVRDLKDATISSFWSGLIAKEVARLQGLDDPEEAFICALLHRLGKLLVIYHLPKEYQQIKSLVSQQGVLEEWAVKEVLAITYKELGKAVARQWNFPDSIFNTMVPLSAEALEDDARPIDPLCAVANFANTLGQIVDTIPQQKRSKSIKRLLKDYRHYITITRDQLDALMGTCLDKLYKHADALQFSVEECGFIMRFCGEELKTPEPEQPDLGQGAEEASSDTSPAFRLAGDDEVEASDLTLDSDDAITILMGGIQEVSNAMMGNHDINDIAVMSLEIIYRALQSKRALLFIHESRSKLMEARYGYGADIQRLKGSLKFEIAAGSGADLFTQALISGKDLIMNDTGAPGLDQHIPLWYRREIDARAFIFLPVAYQKIIVGAYYADMDDAGPPISALEHKYLAMLRNQLVLGIKMGR